MTRLRTRILRSFSAAAPALCYVLAAGILAAASVIFMHPVARAGATDTSDGCPVGYEMQGGMVLGGSCGGGFGIGCASVSFCFPVAACSWYGPGWTGTYPDCVPPPAVPTCAADQGQPCTSAPNSCSLTGQGTYGCDGKCSAATPSVLLCPQPKPVCSPKAGQACSSTPNACKMTSAGTYSCDGSCSALPIPDSSCPRDPLPPPYAQGAYVPPYAQGTYTPTPPPATTPPPYAQGTYTPTPPPATTPPPYAQGTYLPRCGGASATVTATPTLVGRGGTATIQVSATGINNACVLSGPGVQKTFSASSCNAGGVAQTPAITQQSVYTLTCDGLVEGRAIVNVNPWFKIF